MLGYWVVSLKTGSRNFTLSQIKYEINKSKQIKDLYSFAEELLPKLEISNESIKYYASLVSYYSVYRLKRFDQFIVYIYLVCFIYYRYQKIKDNLINSLIYNVRNFYDDAKKTGKEMVYEFKIKSTTNMQKVREILKFFTEENLIDDATPFIDVKNQAFKILGPNELSMVTEYIATKTMIDEVAFRWIHVDKLAHQIKLNIRSVLQDINFTASSENDSLIEAIDFLKTAFEKGKPLKNYSSNELPSAFITDGLKRYLYMKDETGKKQLMADRYEFAVYRSLREALEAGDIFCSNSIRFRSLEDDLLSKERMKQKTILIETSGLTILKQPIREYILTLLKSLEDLILKVNQRIASGKNKYFQIKKYGKKLKLDWSLQYPQASESVNHNFFSKLEQVDIFSIMQFVNLKCNFMDEFEHVLGRYTKKDTNFITIIAAIIAWGTNMGLGKMGEISDISFEDLSSDSNNFIRLESLHKASEVVSNAISEFTKTSTKKNSLRIFAINF